MKFTATILTLAAASALFGLSALAEDTTGTTTETPASPKHRRAERPPPTPEMRAFHEKVLQIYDADKNGKLDPDERQLMREDIQAGKLEAPPRPPRMEGPGGPGGPGGGHRGLPPEIREKYDANKDGKLDETERAALRADVDAGKVQLPPPPPRHEGGEGRKGHRGPPPPPPPEEASQVETAPTQ
jgi:hypothetical protein